MRKTKNWMALVMLLTLWGCTREAEVIELREKEQVIEEVEAPQPPEGGDMNEVKEVPKAVEVEIKLEKDVPAEIEVVPVEPEPAKEPAPEPVSVKEVEPVVVEPEPTPEPAPKTLTSSVKYATPKGLTDLTLTMSVLDRKIQNFSLSGNPAHATSLQNQALFSEGAEGMIVGKLIDEVTVPQKVNGSSLTSTGFREALGKIKDQL